MKTLNFAKWVAAIGCACFLAAAPKAHAIALTIGDIHELGFVNPGIPTGDADQTSYVNTLIGMALGATSGPDGSGNIFTRSLNAFSPLPTAVLTLNTSTGPFSGGSTTVSLGTGGYFYLAAKYDGPNYGTEVWDVNGLTGDITIPTTGGQYGLSGWRLYTPGNGSLPDGGTTALLLGSALAGLGIIKRRLS